MTTRTYWIGCGVFIVAALVFMAPYVCLLAVSYFQKPSQYRFPFSTTKPLTEQDAIEWSRQALILDGKRSNTMRPVRSGHHDSAGRDVFFCRKRDSSDEGWVLWWLERPDHEWEYMVGITREGNEVVCTVSNPL